ncbi:small-conductance mechanosensitive channel [Rhizobium sp. CF122]|uniref:mechanosensitive ion channel family protein n=1 Tax=Rhizobium sp. CF122 TaxID=1144312 RepID=UPI000271CA54|nr:mechanosensitive ion channel family protein [Rhizobium sp. CF122]EJL58534.1 small-conductance mechanosensitive channel [Rhizobium sp. CF122]
MSEETAVDLDVNSAIAAIEKVTDGFATGLHARFSAVLDLPGELANLRNSMATTSTSPLFLCFAVVLVVALTAGTFLVLARQMTIWNPASAGWRRFGLRAAAMGVALAAGVVAARLLTPPGPPLRTLRLWAVVTVVVFVVFYLTRVILTASRRPEFRHRSLHMLALSHDLSIIIGWATIGVALVATLQIWGAGPGLRDLTRTVLMAIPSYLLLAGVVWRHKRTMAAAVAGPRPRSNWRSRLSRFWPAIVIGFLVITFISSQTALTLGAPLPGSAVIVTVLMLLLTPHLDAMIRNWARRKLQAPDVSIPTAAGRQTVRFAILIAAVSMLGVLWATPLALALGFELRSVTRDAFGIALIALLAAFLWNVIGTVTERATIVASPTPGGGELGVPRSRLGTIVPLISAVGKSSILAVALLSILVSQGVNVWPLITGLSVFGLAIGFGSQTLVKDVVSGLFFLIDDAFRFGEYIETSGAKGTVEKISIRSVSLRNSRGSIATVPYGQIGKIQNFSRDWAIEKFSFRVAFETDVELVRRLFKKIGQDIAADPELAPDLIETFKSKGIGDVEDGTLIIKASFTAKPGKQSMIRRAALMAVQNAFRENGIKAVPKPMTADAGPGESG